MTAHGNNHTYFSFIMLLAFFLNSFTLLSAGNKFYFIIRVDDVMSRNTSILPRSIIPFQDTIESRGAFISWAVIPNRLVESSNANGAVTRELRQSASHGHEILMHGFIHICQRCGDSGHEMFCSKNNSGFTYTEQTKLITDSRKILFDSIGTDSYSFVPPGHYADSTTYQVLLDQGIGRISTTLKTKSAIYKSLFNLSAQNEFTWAMTTANYSAQLKTALQDIRSKHDSLGYYCILLHDYFIRSGYVNGIVLRWTGELLDSVKKEYGSDIVFSTLRTASKHFESAAAADLEKRAAPFGFALEQNFPNPFNPSTAIRFTVPADSYVRIDVVSSTGQTVASAADGIFAAGCYTVQWHATSASGVYFIRMDAEETENDHRHFLQTRKMILIR